MTHPDPAQPKDQSALKACPFCDAPAVTNHPPSMWEPGSAKADPTMMSVLCTAGCCYTTMQSTAEAIAAWNQRTEPDELARLRSRVAVLDAINSLADDELKILKREWLNSVKAYHHHEPEVNWIAMPRIAAVYEGLLKALENRND